VLYDDGVRVMVQDLGDAQGRPDWIVSDKISY